MRYKINDIWDFTQIFRYLPSSILQFWNLKANTLVTEWEIWICLLAESVIVPGLFFPVSFDSANFCIKLPTVVLAKLFINPSWTWPIWKYIVELYVTFFCIFQVSVNVLSFFHNLKNKKEKKLFVTYENGNMI